MSDEYAGVVKDGNLLLDDTDKVVETYSHPDAPMVAETPEKLDLSEYEGEHINVKGSLYGNQLWGAEVLGPIADVEETPNSSCLEGEQMSPEQIARKRAYEDALEAQDENLGLTTAGPLAFDGTADVLIQAGHFRHHSWDHNTGAESSIGREIDWTPIVTDEATRILEEAGVSVIKTDASLKTHSGDPGKIFKVSIAVFIHFDGSGGVTGASIGYDHDSDKPAADVWKEIFSRYWNFRWMDDNYTDAEHFYYGFAHTITSDAELLLELGDLDTIQQAQWLKPRLKWLGALVAHFLSQRVGKGNVPDPGPFQVT